MWDYNILMICVTVLLETIIIMIGVLCWRNLKKRERESKRNSERMSALYDHVLDMKLELWKNGLDHVSDDESYNKMIDNITNQLDSYTQFCS